MTDKKVDAAEWSQGEADKLSESKAPEDSKRVADTFSIFILKIKPDSMKQAETFLRNRKWTIGSGTGLREALAYIIQKQPEFVMIAADHPNKKVKILPRLLAQAFPVKVFAFAEGQSGASIASIHEMGQEYNLFPPVSGPAIERIILKIKRDEEKRIADINSQSSSDTSNTLGSNGAPDGGSGIIRLEGAAQNPEEAQKSFEKARAALSQLVNGDGESSDSATGPGSNLAYSGGLQDPNSEPSSSRASGIAYMGSAQDSENTPEKKGGFAYMGGLGDSNQSTPNKGSASGINPATGLPIDPSEIQKSGMAYMGGLSSNENSGPTDQQGPSNGSGFNYMGGMGPNTAGTSGTQNSGPGKKGDFFPQGLDSDEENGNGFDFGGSKKKAQVPIFEQDPKKEDLKNRSPNYKYGRPPGERADSIIVRGTQTALDESVSLKDKPGSINEVKNSSHAACIIVESERFSGYLVAALGENRQIDKSFIDLVKTRLFSFLKAHGEIIKEQDDSMSIKIEQVDFEGWAVEQAEFLRKSIHDGDEIAMAFFPTQETTIKLEESVSEKMLKMDIRELKEDTAVEFDLYIYMPENNKYLLYTPEGRPLYGVQRDRLKDKGVTHMHLRKESSHNVKKYRAQNFLNEKIQAFKAAQQIKNQ